MRKEMLNRSHSCKWNLCTASLEMSTWQPKCIRKLQIFLVRLVPHWCVPSEKAKRCIVILWSSGKKLIDPIESVIIVKRAAVSQVTKSLWDDYILQGIHTELCIFITTILLTLGYASLPKDEEHKQERGDRDITPQRSVLKWATASKTQQHNTLPPGSRPSTHLRHKENTCLFGVAPILLWVRTTPKGKGNFL